MPSKRTIPRTCDECGNPFLASPSEISRGNAHFCSYLCSTRNCNRNRVRIPDDERFWSKVEKTEGCWLWRGSIFSTGYGAFWQAGSQYGAHRLAWEMTGGPIPDGMMVLHTCDDRACVRNDDEGWYEVNGVLRPRRGHLWLGTHQDNTMDCIAKERNNTANGRQKRNAKLTEDDVRDIRRRCGAGDASQADLAREYGLTSSRISNIVTRKAWKQVE